MEAQRLAVAASYEAGRNQGRRRSSNHPDHAQAEDRGNDSRQYRGEMRQFG